MKNKTMLTARTAAIALSLLLLSSASAASAVAIRNTDAAFAVPLNGYMLMAGFPDGTKSVFFRDPASLSTLYGPSPWVGEERGGFVRILTRSDAPGEKRAYLFRGGRLVRSFEGGRDETFEPGEIPAIAEKAEDFFSAGKSAGVPGKVNQDVWANSGRLKLGFQNPNKAGVLCAEIALAGLALLCLWRKLPALAGLPLVGAGLFALAKTASRGALAGFVAGAVAIVALSLRSRFTAGGIRFGRRKIAVTVMAAVAVVALVCVGMKNRFSGGVVDLSGESDATRVAIWREAPRMMVDAPHGWGWGKSGNAYNHWYQDPSNLRVVRTLVNSHLTFLVENGWILRFAYLFAWFTGLWLMLRAAWRGNAAARAASGIWIAFAVSACFNSTAESPVLWAVPVATLLPFVRRGGREAFTGFRRPAVCCAGAAAAVLCAFAVAGAAGRSAPSIRASGGVVMVNGDKPQTWVVDDGRTLGEGFTGKSIRIAYGKNPQTPAIAYTSSIEAVCRNPETLVLAGTSGSDFIERWRKGGENLPVPKKIVFLSPSFGFDEIPFELALKCRFRAIAGEFALACGGGAGNVPSFVDVVPGCALYVPDWLARVTSPAHP